MNREQRRKLEKQLVAKGATREQAKMLIQIHTDKGSLKEGDRVRLNMKSILEQPDYANMNPKYKQWVEDNKDKVFTVEYDEKHGENSTLVCLREDESDPRWLFWVGNLEKVSGE